MQDKETQRMVSTTNETMVRQTQNKNGKKNKNDKRSSIEVQEKQTGPIPKEPDWNNMQGGLPRPRPVLRLAYARALPLNKYSSLSKNETLRAPNLMHFKR